MGIGVLSLVLICAFLMLETPESGEKPQQQDAGARAEALFCAPITENGHNDASASGKSDGGEKPQPKPEENAQGLSANKQRVYPRAFSPVPAGGPAYIVPAFAGYH